MDSFWFDTMLELSPSDCLWVGKMDKTLFTIADSEMFWNIKRKRDDINPSLEYQTKKDVLDLYRRRTNIERDIDYVVTNFISLKGECEDCTSLQYLEDGQLVDCISKSTLKRYEYSNRYPIQPPEESDLFQRPSFKKRRDLTNSHDDYLAGYVYEYTFLDETRLPTCPDVEILYQDVDVVIYKYLTNVKICRTMYVSTFDLMEENGVLLCSLAILKNVLESKIVCKKVDDNSRFVVLIENHLFDVDLQTRFVQSNSFSIPNNAVCSAIEIDDNVAYYHINYGLISKTISLYYDPNLSPPYHLEHVSSYHGFTSCVFWKNSLGKKYLVYYFPALGEVIFHKIDKSQCEGVFNIYFQTPRIWNEKVENLIQRYKITTTDEKIFIQIDRSKWIMLNF